LGRDRAPELFTRSCDAADDVRRHDRRRLRIAPPTRWQTILHQRYSANSQSISRGAVGEFRIFRTIWLDRPERFLTAEFPAETTHATSEWRRSVPRSARPDLLLDPQPSV